MKKVLASRILMMLKHKFRPSKDYATCRWMQFYESFLNNKFYCIEMFRKFLETIVAILIKFPMPCSMLDLSLLMLRCIEQINLESSRLDFLKNVL